MVIGIIGESCTGKSTLAKNIRDIIGGEIYSGSDYLRLAKNEEIARKLFQKKLISAVDNENIIYVISEKEHLLLLPEKAIRVLITADLDQIKQRFAQRMNGTLPFPVATMLERKHGCFDNVPHDIHVISGNTELEKIYTEIQKIQNNRTVKQRIP